MAESENSFGETANKLSRNPLGIIALFIVLVYAFAALIVGLNSNLEAAQKWPLVWFLVIFPVLVLAVFTWLVIGHHKKLYAPTDYRSDESFLKLSIEQQKERLEEEINELKPAEETNKVSASPTALPEKNAIEKQDIKTSYILAENLVIRELEIDLSATIKRQVAVKTRYEVIPFDGITTDNAKVTAIEVKLVTERGITREAIDAILFRATKAESHFSAKGTSFLFIFAIVIDSSVTDISKIKQRILSWTASSPYIIQVRFYDFAELKNKFGVDKTDT